MTSKDLLGQAVEALYSADPGEFTRRRGELAAGARAAGQPAVARQIAGLRKPTRSAWIINQLMRSDPGAAARLAGLGEELRAAERSRDGSRLRDLAQARRQLIAILVRQALTRSGQHPPPAALREEITATFGAALADPEVAEQLRRATLLRPARRPGFGAVQAPALVLVPALPAAPPAVTTQSDPERERHRTSGQADRAPGETARGRRPRAEPSGNRRARAGTRPGRNGTARDRAGTGRYATRAEAGSGQDATRAEAEAERTRAKAERTRAKAERTRAQAERTRAQARQQRAQARQERAKAEQERRGARAKAEQALADAERAEQAACRAQQRQEEAARRLEQQLTDVRRRLREARAQTRQAEIERRKARQVLGRLPE